MNSLYGLYEEAHPGFVAKYFDMLKAGGTKHHSELLAPFGLDASKPEFWQKGLKVIEGMIDELRARPTRRLEATRFRACSAAICRDGNSVAFVAQVSCAALFPAPDSSWALSRPRSGGLSELGGFPRAPLQGRSARHCCTAASST